MEEVRNEQNPLGTEPESVLLRKFAIPSIIAMLVGSLYNIVDQFFIGRAVGPLGNAATNIAFPLTTLCIAIALMFGIGGASVFNITMGEGQPEKAKHYIGNAVTMMISVGIVMMVITLIFMDRLMILFGSPAEVLPYVRTYAGITAFGFPALILSAGGAHIIRADGSPNMTMMVNIIGAVVNTVLDALFVFVLNMGMAGAAYATIIGQYVSAGIIIWYLPHFKTVPLTKDTFIPKWEYTGRIVTLGTAPFINQIAFLAVQVTMNNSLRHYGALSVYGESTPIAVSGIVMKVFQVAGAFVIGISQGLQPIASFNFGAKQYGRVKNAFFDAIKSGAVICFIAFALFQLFPVQILSFFGSGDELYYEFGVKYMRIFVFFICLFFMQPIASNFFTSIGKPYKGIFMSLTRQVIFFLPLLVILPVFFGIDGVVYTGPIADLISCIVCAVMVYTELKKPEWHLS